MQDYTETETDLNINKISHGFIVKHLTQNEVRTHEDTQNKSKYLTTQLKNLKSIKIKCSKNIVILKELSRIIDLIISYKELQVLCQNVIY